MKRVKYTTKGNLRAAKYKVTRAIGGTDNFTDSVANAINKVTTSDKFFLFAIIAALIVGFMLGFIHKGNRLADELYRQEVNAVLMDCHTDIECEQLWAQENVKAAAIREAIKQVLK